MSEDKLKLTPKQKDEVQIAFEEFGEHKYVDWKNKKVATQQEQPVDNRTEEQKKFETYLDAQEFYKAPITYIFKDLDNTTECMDKGAGIYRVGYPQTQHKPDGFGLKVNDVGVVEIMFENMERRDRPQIIQRYTSLETLRTFMRCYAPYTLGAAKWQPWKEVGTGGGGTSKSPYKSRVVKATGTPAKSFAQYEKMANGRNSIYLYNDSTVGYQDMKLNDFVTIVIEKGKITDNTKMTMNIYGRVLNYKGGMFNELEYDGIGYSTGIDTYTREQIDDAIAHAGGGGQGGGTAMKYIEIPTGDRTNITKTVQGDFACNLINYRQLSKESGKLGTVGSHLKVMNNEKKTVQIKPLPHVIKTKYKAKLEGNTKDTYGGTIGLSGIKEGKKLLMNTTWYQIPKTDDQAHRTGTFKISLMLDDYSKSTLQTSQEDVQFNSTSVTESANRTPNTIGRYALDLGSNGDAEFFAVNFHAFYTKNPDRNPLIPHNLDRSFVFGNYNGHELRASYDLADEYHETAIGNKIVRKVGRVKLKDLVWDTALDVNPDAQHFLYAKVPDDCKVPDRWDNEQQMKELGGKLLTNNLSEVRPEDILGHGQQSHLEALKFDTNAPCLEKIIQTIPRAGKRDEWCFVIISNRDNARHWQELLSETEILYELKEPITEYLKEGGYVVELADGRTLYSHDFFEVKDVPSKDCYFFRYNSNGQGIRVHKSQIVSVSPVNEI